MRYYVTLDPSPNATPTLVDVSELPSGALSVAIDGKPAEVDVVSIAGQLSVRVDGQMVDLTVEGTPPEIGCVASGHRSYVRVESERSRAADAAKRGKGGALEKVIKAPMPGRIVKVLVKSGDEIEVGQPLLVIEAMKMENEVRAKAACTVGEIHVAEGATVEANAKLISLA